MSDAELLAYVKAALTVSGIQVDSAEKQLIAEIFRVVLEHGERVTSFPLPDDAELAPVFEA